MAPQDEEPVEPGDVGAASAAVLDDVGHLMGTVAHALGSREVLALHDLGLTLRSYGVLVCAARATITQAQLAAVTGTDRATLVGLLDDLESAGLVRRAASATDRRTRLVVLTADGRELSDRAERLVRRVEDDALADLDPGQRRALLETLRTLGAGRLATAVDVSHLPTARRRRPSTGRLS